MDVPPAEAIARLQESVASLLDGQEETRELVEKTLEQCLITNGRVNRMEDTIFGSVDERRRQANPGLEARFVIVEKAYTDARAVTKATWALLSFVGFSTIVGVIALIIQATQ